jgi:hypothetical protein
MAYTVNFTNEIQKIPITIDDNSRNTSATSLTLIGRNEPSYGQAIAENFVHILENFANPTAPNNPIEGQLWYDSGTNRLYINDSTAGSSNWRPAGGVHVEAIEPSNPITGDVWVDTTNNQLYIYTGAQFQLVGPSFSGGLKSGAEAEKVTDTTGAEHTIIKNYVDDKVVTIISKDQFIPRQVIEGFTELYPGINISGKDFDGNGIVLNKLHASATKADALSVTQPAIEVVDANNFLRSDITDTMNGQLFVRNNGGVTIGSNQIFNLEIAGSNAVIKNNSVDSNIDFKVFPTATGVIETALRIDGANRRVGINQLSPQATLDVTGSGHFTETLQAASSIDVSSDLSTAALKVSGGAAINKAMIVGGNLTTRGHLRVGEDAPVDGATGIAPSVDNKLEIGTSSLRFKNIHSQVFTGRLNGTVVGDVTGNVNGTADRLVASTVFKIGGHVSDTTGFSFDGQTGGSTKTFNVTLTQDAIDDQDAVTTTDVNDDTLILSRKNAGLKKIAYTDFFSNAPTVPVGAILPYAGTAAPTGYLLCDGSEVAIGSYNDLYNVVGTTFGTGVNPSTFKLPDLRGRFALGLDNMDNNLSVQDINNNPVDAGGGVAGRVTDSSALALAGTGGKEVKDITDNTEGHTGTQYTDSTGSGVYSNVDVMNPYLALNYIIRYAK